MVDHSDLWKYHPSKPAAIIFIILFTIALGAHIYKAWTTKSRFCIPFIIGCLFEIIGYCGRAAAASDISKLLPYILQSLFILVAPALFAASIYMTLGRLIRSIGAEKHSLIRVTWLTKIFVLGDVLSFFIQCGSAGLMFSESTVGIGQDVVLVGLFVQIVMFGIFGVVAVIFELRLRASPTPLSLTSSIPWKQSLNMLYAVSVLIMIRSIFRVIEYAMGQSGYPLKHEWTLYIFDALLMFIVTVVFWWWYPSRLVGDGYGGVEVIGERESGVMMVDRREERAYGKV